MQLYLVMSSLTQVFVDPGQSVLILLFYRSSNPPDAVLGEVEVGGVIHKSRDSGLRRITIACA